MARRSRSQLLGKRALFEHEVRVEELRELLAELRTVYDRPNRSAVSRLDRQQ